MPVDPNRIEEVFLAAVAIPPGERAAFLDMSCSSDVELREAVTRLLAAHANPASILKRGIGPLPLTALHTQQPDVGIVLAGRYKLLERIGEGGMGAVWVAQQIEPIKRTVAVKLIKPGMDSKNVLARFEAERQALAMMDHPNIARVLDAGIVPDGHPFFVMELVRGDPITQFCDSRRLNLHERLELFVPVCHAVQHAHQKGVIHRDLKPSNVLVALYDDHPVPKIIDFGVAKAITQPLTEHTLHTGFGTVIGTPQYMSPEQATFNNLDVDTRSDLYSLGVLLYELLTGSPPFSKRELEKAGVLEMLRVVREVEPQRPSAKLSTADALPSLAANRGMEPRKLTGLLRNELDWIVMKALEKDRARRYETASGFAADVLRYLAGEPVQAVPPSGSYRLRKFVRKHKGPVLAVLIVLSTLLAGILGTSLGLIRTEQARHDEAGMRVRAEEAENLAQLEARHAREEAGKAQASAVAERLALQRTQNMLGLGYAHDGVRLAADDRIGLGMLKMVHSLNVVPENEDTAAIARTQFALYHRYARAPYRVHLLFPHGSSLAIYSPDNTRVLTADLRQDSKHSAWLWDAESGELLREFPNPTGILSAAFSPDGQRVATGCLDGSTRIWDVQGGDPIAQLKTHADGVRAVAFSPDGRLLLTVSFDATAQVWKVDNWSAPNFVFKHDAKIWDAAFSPDGKYILTGSGDNTARIWSVETRKHPYTIPHLPAAVMNVTYSPDGRLFATGCENGNVRIWETATGQAVSSFSHTDAIRWLAFSPEGRRIATASNDHTAIVWEAQTGKRITPPLKHDDMVWGIAFSPDGRRVVTGSVDGTARVWDSNTGLPLSEWLQHSASIGPVSFTRDGRRILISSDAARIWEITGEEYHSTPTTPTDSPLPYFRDRQEPVAQSPDGRWVAIGGFDFFVRVLDTATGKIKGQPLKLSAAALSIAFSPNSRRVVIGCQNGTAAIWEFGGTKPSVPLRSREGEVAAVAYSPDGRLVLTGGWNGSEGAQLWDAETGDPVGEPLPNCDTVRSVAFSPDGRRFAIGCRDSGRATLWETQTRRLVQTIRHGKGVLFLTFSPDSCLLLTGSEDLFARILNAENGETLHSLKHAWFVSAGAFSPDGTRILTGSYDKGRVWDVKTGNPLIPPLTHSDLVTSVAFSPDSKRLLTASTDCTARLWDAATGIPLSPPFHHTNAVKLIAFTKDMFSCLTCSARDSIQNWDLSPDRRSIPEIVEMAQFLGGHRIDHTGAFAPISNVDFEELWKKVRSRTQYPPISMETIRRWREREIRDSMNEWDVRGAQFHFWALAAELATSKSR
jgi:eukaryotic-like serine/threonine-protein kinase